MACADSYSFRSDEATDLDGFTQPGAGSRVVGARVPQLVVHHLGNATGRQDGQGSCAAYRSQNWRPVVSTSRLDATMCGIRLKCAQRAVMLRARPWRPGVRRSRPRPGWVGVGAMCRPSHPPPPAPRTQADLVKHAHVQVVRRLGQLPITTSTSPWPGGRGSPPQGQDFHGTGACDLMRPPGNKGWPQRKSWLREPPRTGLGRGRMGRLHHAQGIVHPRQQRVPPGRAGVARRHRWLVHAQATAALDTLRSVITVCKTLMR